MDATKSLKTDLSGNFGVNMELEGGMKDFVESNAEPQVKAAASTDLQKITSKSLKN